MIVLDTNILISALNFPKGNPHRLLAMAMDGEVEVAISDAIMAELLRVLREKFHATPDDLREAEEMVADCTHRVNPTEKLSVITEDPDDDRILECAVASGSDAIVTGDKDLLRRGQYQGIRILTVAQLLERGRER